MADPYTAMRTMRDLLDRNAHLHGAEPHLKFAGATSTFAQFRVRALKLANALHRLGVKAQDRVAILAMNCREYLEVYGMAESSAFIVAPVNFRLAAPEMQFVIGDVLPRALIFEHQYAGIVGGLRERLPTVEHFICIGGEPPSWALGYEELIAAAETEGAPHRPVPDHLLSILYTSGTTGRPKGAMITHRVMLSLGAAWSVELAADLGDRVLVCMPMFHIGARSQSAALTHVGGTVVMLRAFDAAAVAKTVEEERITQLHLAPTLVQAVLDLPDLDRYDLSSLKTINYAAAPMPLTVLKRALQRFGPIMINGFGQTEGGGTTLRKAYHRPEGGVKDLKRLTSVGQPLHDTRVCILDGQDHEVETGAIGEICFRSPQNMLGYWNNSAATIETLRNGWLHTGDMGYVDEDGFVYLADRKKDMIVTGGENVYSREVEEALMSHPAIADAAVIGVPDLRWGEAVKAVVVAKPGAKLDAADLIGHCRQFIAGYKCPKSIDFVDELPRLPSGKVNKVSLRSQYAS
ncbi:MAG TPA: long-chain-fatty-acid--CoA ligase [Steroidobacteraceae bacterium]|nr:long-chain-fatty-acid--CoA ligase [Steroidobacteraceae bacterium]